MYFLLKKWVFKLFDLVRLWCHSRMLSTIWIRMIFLKYYYIVFQDTLEINIVKVWSYCRYFQNILYIHLRIYKILGRIGKYTFFDLDHPGPDFIKNIPKGKQELSVQRSSWRARIFWYIFHGFIINAQCNICPVYDKRSAYFCIEVVVLKHESHSFNTVRHFDNEAAVFSPLALFSIFRLFVHIRGTTCAPFLSLLRLHMYVRVVYFVYLYCLYNDLCTYTTGDRERCCCIGKHSTRIKTHLCNPEKCAGHNCSRIIAKHTLKVFTRDRRKRVKRWVRSKLHENIRYALPCDVCNNTYYNS